MLENAVNIGEAKYGTLFLHVVRTGIAGLLRACGERPRRRSAERGYQFPPSDNGWHCAPPVRGLPSERDDTTL